MTSTETCPICCEGHLVKSESTIPLVVASKQIHIEQHGHVCDLCGTEMATAEDLKFNARTYRAAELRANGRMNGHDIKELRSRLNLSHKLAGKVFGGGPVAFCKYENHEITPTDAMDNLLWIANKFPFVVNALAERHQVVLPNIMPATPEISLDMKALSAEIVSKHIVSATVRGNSVYKMWEHVAINMGQSPHASNEMAINFESAIAA